MIAELDPKFAWWLSRSTGIVATVLLTASVLWGVLLATRVLKPIDRPPWLMAIHRWFSALTCIFVAVHIAALVADNWVHIGWREILLPGASRYRPSAVTVGVVAMYLLAAVQVTSLLMKRISKAWWRGIHLMSYAAVWLSIVHGALAGTDASAPAYRIGAWVVVAVTTLAAATRVLVGTTRSRRAKSGPAQRAAPIAARPAE